MAIADNQQKLIANLVTNTTMVFMVSFIAAKLGNVIDCMIIGKFLGAEAIAAFGLSSPYQNVVDIFPCVVALGTQVLCGKTLSTGDITKANKIFSQAVTAVLFVSAISVVLTWLFPKEIIELSVANEHGKEIVAMSADYIEAFALGLPAMALVTILSPLMQIDSDRNRAMIAVIVLGVSNCAGDLIGIFVFDCGMWGIGIATTVSYCISLIVLDLHFRKPTANFAYKFDGLDFGIVREILLNGQPIIFGRIAWTGTVIALNMLSMYLAGDAGLAALTILFNFATPLWKVPNAFSSSVQMIGTIFIGDHDRHSIRQLMSVAIKLSVLFSATVSAAVIFFAPSIAQFYMSGNSHTASPQVFQMTVDAFRFFALTLPVNSICEALQYFYQAYGRYKIVNLLAFLQNFLMTVMGAMILTPFVGIDGLWLAFFFSSIGLLFASIVITCIHHKRLTFKPEDYLLLPADFDVPEDKQLNITVTTAAEVLNLAERAQTFCAAHGVDVKRSMYAGICIEEMAGNIVAHGFDDGKKHFVAVRLLISGNEVIIRLSDDCKSFDPKKWQEIYNPDDPSSHIGIRLVCKIATKFDYVNLLKLNSLLIKI